MIHIGRTAKGTGATVAAPALLGLLLVGCGGSQSSQQALTAQLQSLSASKAKLARFAGKVTIDNQSPTIERGQSLLVMLYNQKDPEKNKPPLSVACQNDGSFAFYTYERGDGVPEGSYVVLFAQLYARRGAGMVQPDALKNLYDDPDKNAQNKDFVVELTSPGKTDYAFNLELAGQEPATPGPNAVTEIRKAK